MVKVKVKNEKVTVDMKINNVDKIYIYKVNTGEAYEYKDPFNYGTKTKETLVPGDDITLGTEKFRVFYNQNGVIKAMPWYNLVIVTADGTVKQGPSVNGISTGISSTFSTINYWSKGDDSINMIDTRNNIQQYIQYYKTTLNRYGIEDIEVRIVKKSELDNSEVTSVMKNPGGAGFFWTCSGNSVYTDKIFRVNRSW